MTEKPSFEDIKHAIVQTGFPLEHYIDHTLREHGWQTITNRYYIDDIKGVEREIDIIAYKSSRDDDEQIIYFTTLIISCKKSDRDGWCFFTRNIDNSHNDYNLTPVHYCATDKKLIYIAELNRSEIVNEYFNHNHKYSSILENTEEQIFAYQQIQKGKNKEFVFNGNGNIYDSIITSIKALEDEKKSRIKDYIDDDYKRLYNFHLISVFDGDMYKIFFDENEKQTVSEINQIRYLNRHIINNEQNFYIVDFVKKDIFAEYLQKFEKIHNINVQKFPLYLKQLYHNAFEYTEVTEVLNWDGFEKELLEIVRYEIARRKKDYSIYQKISEINYFKNIMNNSIKLSVNHLGILTKEDFHYLNLKLKDETGKLLYKYFRYTGAFYFEEGHPF